MKTDPRHGYFPRWPQDSDDWIHAADVDLAKRMIHSNRVWLRDGENAPFVVLHYGDVHLRVLPALWIEIEGEDIEMGDWVEVLSRMHKNTYGIARVCEMVWDDRHRAIRYKVEKHARQPIPTAYYRADLRPVNAIESSPQS
jgi:hypothetical protein